MPIYEYLCAGCAARIEVKQKLSDPPLTTCEHCGKALTKLISAPGIMFKGSGWYVTDYSDKLKPPSGAEPKSGSSGEKSKTSSEAKSEGKGEGKGTSESAASPGTPPATTGATSSGSGASGSAPASSKPSGS